MTLETQDHGMQNPGRMLGEPTAGRWEGWMRRRGAVAAFAALAAAACVNASGPEPRSIAIVWNGAGTTGSIVVRRGSISQSAAGDVSATGAFSCPSSLRVELSVVGADTLSNAERTLVTVQSERNPFTFFLDDVRREHPIFIPAFGVAVTEARDKRSYRQIAEEIRARGLRSDLERIKAEPEESFEDAAGAGCRSGGGDGGAGQAQLPADCGGDTSARPPVGPRAHRGRARGVLRGCGRRRPRPEG